MAQLLTACIDTEDGTEYHSAPDINYDITRDGHLEVQGTGIPAEAGKEGEPVFGAVYHAGYWNSIVISFKEAEHGTGS